MKGTHFIPALLPVMLAACGGEASSGDAFFTPIASPTVLATYYSGVAVIGGVSAPFALYVGSQTNGNVIGTWGSERANLANVGTFAGTARGSSVVATLSSSVTYQSVSLCSMNLRGVVSGTAMTGSLTATSGCSPPASGTFALTESPAPPAFAPSASGSLSDALFGSGTLNLTIAQTGATLTGAYASSFGASQGTSGQFYALVVGSTLYLDLLPNAAQACFLSGVGAIYATTISGTYAARQCSIPEDGTFTLSPF